jgi:hypothetical protein
MNEDNEPYLCECTVKEIQREISRDLWEEIGKENGWFDD